MVGSYARAAWDRTYRGSVSAVGILVRGFINCHDSVVAVKRILL